MTSADSQKSGPKMLKTALVTALTLLLAGPAVAAADVDGLWLAPSREAHVKISHCGEALCGKVRAVTSAVFSIFGPDFCESADVIVRCIQFGELNRPVLRPFCDRTDTPQAINRRFSQVAHSPRASAAIGTGMLMKPWMAPS